MIIYQFLIHQKLDRALVLTITGMKTQKTQMKLRVSTTQSHQSTHLELGSKSARVQ